MVLCTEWLGILRCNVELACRYEKTIKWVYIIDLNGSRYRERLNTKWWESVKRYYLVGVSGNVQKYVTVAYMSCMRHPTIYLETAFRYRDKTKHFHALSVLIISSVSIPIGSLLFLSLTLFLFFCFEVSQNLNIITTTCLMSCELPFPIACCFSVWLLVFNLVTDNNLLKMETVSCICTFKNWHW